ncbi:MAG: fibronectin type III domain-containing protein [Candidatus Cloacimonadaceae bacterium]|nr:fibronectin type III domain-containing protein [Candidatus Cloacimonadaceae bacterium]
MEFIIIDIYADMLNTSISGGNVLNLLPLDDWYGTEYITIRATNQWGLFVEQVLQATVLETWATLENFNNSGIIPTNWTTQHTGTTTYPWQPFQVSGTDYGMKTKAVTGTTANERLLSPTYNLSGYKDIEVSFDTAFLPYGSGTGTFAYTLNNVTYTTVEIFSTSTSGIKTYTIPALDAKPSVRFRWNYVNGAANIGQENYWTVDNFRIFGLVRDVTAPTIVTGLEAMALTSTSATLHWNPSTDTYFEKYEIYISTDAQVTTSDQLWSVLNDAMLNNINTIQTAVYPLATSNYWAAIRAVDQSGNASLLSEVVNFQIDGTAPVFSAPLPSNQPNPEWVNSLTATIGCTITDANQIDQNSIQYRIDANGNGIYDISEAWQAVTRTDSYNIDRNFISISVEATYQVDGVLAYEFKAADLNGNIAYSGDNSIEGISDDWVVRLDVTAPDFSNPIPINQPNPTWTNNRTVTIGCSISDNLEIPLGSIEYRFDRNGNGNYDADEPWVQYSNQRQERNSRNQIIVSVEVLFEADGLLHFEFRAMDQVGNVGFSGTNNADGMSDDWIVRVYATPPVFSNPIPGNQPNPNWSTTRTVTIGVSVASFDSSTSSVYYRYDSNGNGMYDLDEAWTPINQRNGIRTIRDRSAVTTQINFSSDGIFTFEFKAEDSLGNIGYSGLNGVLGIDDDWVVKINSNPPQITNPTPSNQPLPAWQTSRTVIIEAEISSDVLLNEDSIRFRFDQNKNSVYDPDEIWQSPIIISNDLTRQNQIVIQAEIQVSNDGVYSFEIKASDQNGLTGYSGIQHLEGIADDWVFRIDTIAPAAISNFFVEATTDNTIQLNWTASSDLNFLEYRVYYSLNPVVTMEDSMWCGAEDPNLLASGSGLITTTISGLIPSTRYYFMVYAIDAAGLSTHYPSVITAMTTSSTQPASPQNVDLTVAGSLLIIDWDDVTTDVLGNLIGISYYEVHVGDNPNFMCSSESLISTVTESTLTLTDVVDYADRLFFKVIAVSGTIRN